MDLPTYGVRAVSIFLACSCAAQPPTAIALAITARKARTAFALPGGTDCTNNGVSSKALKAWRNSSGNFAMFAAIRRASSFVSSFAVSRHSFEVKVYADNAARALCNSAKNLSY